MSFIAFNGQGYNSFVAESKDLVHWSNPRLAMGFGPRTNSTSVDAPSAAFLYESYDLKAPRLLKKRDGEILDPLWLLSASGRLRNYGLATKG